MIPSTNQQGYLPGSRQQIPQLHVENGLEPPSEPFPYADYHSSDTDNYDNHNNHNNNHNNSSSSTGISISSIRRSSRFSKWLALMALSLVTWFATIGSARRHPMNRAERWALSATTLTTISSLLGAACFLWARSVFAGQLPEVILVGMIVVVWAGALPVLMDPANDIAVSFSDSLNANLYFGSWLSFGCALLVADDLVQERYGYNVVNGVVVSLSSSPMMAAANNGGGGGKWASLIITSLIALCSSLRTFHAFQCQTSVMSLAPTCRQTKFAIAVSVLGTLVSLLVLFLLMKITMMMMTTMDDEDDADGRQQQQQLRQRQRRIVQRWSSVFMTILWSFGLGYTTFGDGPGRNIGNLYFSTWTSFLLSVLLTAESFFFLGGNHDSSMMMEEVPPSLSSPEQEMSSSGRRQDTVYVHHEDDDEEDGGNDLFLHQDTPTTTRTTTSTTPTPTSSATTNANVYHAADDETFDDAHL